MISEEAKHEAQAGGVKYGCHCDLDAGQAPDGCVKDQGADDDCIYARRHKTREACQFWLPVHG